MSRRPTEYDLTLPDALALRGLPKQLEVRDGIFHVAEAAQPAALVDTDKFAAKLASDWAQAVVTPGQFKQALAAYVGMGRMMRLLLVKGAAVPQVDRPPSAALVLPAAQAVFKVIPIIRDEARFAVRNLPVAQAKEVAAQLAELQDLQAANDAVSADVAAIMALCETHLYEFVRVFDYKTYPLIEDDTEVAQRLLPVDTLLRGAARRAVETRRTVDKAAREQVAKALNDQAAKAGAAPAPAPTPAVPPAPRSGKPA